MRRRGVRSVRGPVDRICAFTSLFRSEERMALRTGECGLFLFDAEKRYFFVRKGHLDTSSS